MNKQLMLYAKSTRAHVIWAALTLPMYTCCPPIQLALKGGHSSGQYRSGGGKTSPPVRQFGYQKQELHSVTF